MWGAYRQGEFSLRQCVIRKIPAESTVGSGLSPWLPLAFPWVSLHGHLAGWRGSLCFSSDYDNCSGSRQHPGSSKASRGMMAQKVLYHKSPSKRRGSFGVLGGNRSIRPVLSTSGVPGKVLALCLCQEHLCTPTAVLRCRDRYSHRCFQMQASRGLSDSPKGWQIIKGRPGF